jgi:hypothetical protein
VQKVYQALVGTNSTALAVEGLKKESHKKSRSRFSGESLLPGFVFCISGNCQTFKAFAATAAPGFLGYSFL